MCIKETISVSSLNQRASGPVNAHLIPGIYTNTCIHVLVLYIAPGQGQNSPWVQDFDVNRNS